MWILHSLSSRTMMSSQTVKPAKQAKSPNGIPSSSSSSSRSSSLSSSVASHLAMVELKQRIFASLSKIGDRDTYQIAAEDLEKIVESISPETLPMLLNCLYDSCNDPKTAIKKESLRLLSFVCQTYRDLSQSHLTRIIAHIVKRLKDADSGVRDACRDAIGALSAQYLKGSDGNAAVAGSLVGLFARPLFGAMAEQNKSLQSGAAICMAKMLESPADPPVEAFQKLCPRICKLLNNPNFLAKASLLTVISSLSQVEALAPQSLDSLLQSIHELLGSTDWVTRKTATDTLISLASHSSSLISYQADSTVAVLEACRFDKIKPVRDSLAEALNLWKRIAERGEDGAADSQKSNAEKDGRRQSNVSGLQERNSSDGPSNNFKSASTDKSGNNHEKAVLILKKNVAALTNKPLNPDFFQQLGTRESGDVPVEVVLPGRTRSSSTSNNEDDSEPRGEANYLDKTAELQSKQRYFDGFARDKWLEERMRIEESRTRSFHDKQGGTDSQSEGSSFLNDAGNWSALQRQLLHMERQQAHLMKMVQDFTGGSSDGMVTLENRVRRLERVVQEMARDLSSSGIRSNAAMISEYSDRALGTREMGSTWRSDVVGRGFPQDGASRNGHTGARRAREAGLLYNRSNNLETETEIAGTSRKAWDKSGGSFMLGEGPSARSVWQASKDEATIEAIRGTAEESGTSRAGRMAMLEEEALVDENNNGVQRDPTWTSWSNAIHALRVGDTDEAYAEVLSTEDDSLLVRLMDRTGPVVDQLSDDIANQVLDAIVQFLLDSNLLNICLSWIQQLLQVVLENGPEALGICMDLRKEILLNLYETCSTTDPPAEWEGVSPDQLLVQLASAWEIELQRFED